LKYLNGLEVHKANQVLLQPNCNKGGLKIISELVKAHGGVVSKLFQN